MEKKIKYLLRILAIIVIIVVFVTLAVMFLPNFVIKTKKMIGDNHNNKEKIEFVSNNGLLAVFSKLDGFEYSSTTDQLALNKGNSKVLIKWINRGQAEEFAKQEMIYSRQLENDGLVRNDYELAKPLEGDLNLATIVWSGDQVLLVAYNRSNLLEAERLLESIQISTVAISENTVASSSATTTVNRVNVTKPALVKSDGYVVNLFFPKIDSSDCQQLGSISIKIKDVETELGLIPSVVKIIMQYPVSELEKLGFKPLFSENIRLLSFGYSNNTAVLNFNELLRANSVCPINTVKNSLLQTMASLRSSSSLQIKSVDIQIDGQKLK